MLLPYAATNPRKPKGLDFRSRIRHLVPSPLAICSDVAGMCKPAGANPTKGESACATSFAGGSSDVPVGGQAPSPVAPSRMAIAAFAPPFARSLAQPPFTRRKIVLLVILSSILLASAFFASLYTFHRGFRRTVQFWRGMLPLVAKYKWLKIKATKVDGLTEDDDEYQRRITAYRQTTAPQLVDLILSLGGIYTKIGQVSSSVMRVVKTTVALTYYCIVC